MGPKVIIMMGVSGCGKTTVGQLVSGHLQCEFIEGDEYHSPENIAKMCSGQPLNDDDRFDWMMPEYENRGSPFWGTLRLSPFSPQGKVRKALPGLGAPSSLRPYPGSFEPSTNGCKPAWHYMKAGMSKASSRRWSPRRCADLDLLLPPRNCGQVIALLSFSPHSCRNGG